MTGTINKASIGEVKTVQRQFIGKVVENISQARPFETDEYHYN
jgi:hypothetical protein